MSEPRAVATGSFAIFHLAISNPRHLSKRNRLSKYSNEKCQMTNDRLSGSDTLRFPKSDSFVCKLKAGEDQGSLIFPSPFGTGLGEGLAALMPLKFLFSPYAS